MSGGGGGGGSAQHCWRRIMVCQTATPHRRCPSLSSAFVCRPFSDCVARGRSWKLGRNGAGEGDSIARTTRSRLSTRPPRRDATRRGDIITSAQQGGAHACHPPSPLQSGLGITHACTAYERHACGRASTGSDATNSWRNEKATLVCGTPSNDEQQQRAEQCAIRIKEQCDTSASGDRGRARKRMMCAVRREWEAEAIGLTFLTGGPRRRGATGCVRRP